MNDRLDVIPGLELVRINCPLCDSADSRLVVTTKDYFCRLPGEYSFDECKSCGHVFMNPQPTIETVQLCYPQDYVPHRTVADHHPRLAQSRESVEPTELVHARPFYARAPFRWIPGLRKFYGWLTDERTQLVPAIDKASPQALELGCASGASAEAVDKAQQHGLNVQHATVEAANLNSDAFDVVFAWMVLEHIHDVPGALGKIHASLRSGGMFCFSVPNAGCWERRAFGRYWLGYDAPRHLHQFTANRLRQQLHTAGFPDVEIIHQRNLRYVYGSFAARLLARRPESPLGQRLMRWFGENPPLWFQLITALPAIMLAWVGQAGRLTVIARKPV